MNTPISDQDLERLSAYLDRALKPDETRRVEARLQQEPELAAALQQLSVTRGLLRRAPRRRVPHNFTLTPAMAGVRPESRGWLGWGLASATASLLLVATLLGNLAAQPSVWLMGAAAPMAEEPSAEIMAEPMLEMAPKEGEQTDEAANAAPEEPLQDSAESPVGGTGEAGQTEMFAVPSAESRAVPAEPAPFDWRFFLIEYGAWVEIGLAAIAGATGVTAWRRRRGL